MTGPTLSRNKKVFLLLFRIAQNQGKNEREKGKTQESAHPQAQGSQGKWNRKKKKGNEGRKGV